LRCNARHHRAQEQEYLRTGPLFLLEEIAMQWLTALLAFAVTMLIFAIIVSTLVEMVHRLFNLRAKGMQLMLENLYENVIGPHLSNKGDKTAFALSIMTNRASATDSGSALIAPMPKAEDTLPGAGGVWPWLKKLPGRFVNSISNAFDFRLMTDVPVEVFTQKLANSTIVDEAAKLTEPILKDIAQKYLAYGDEIGKYFERRAKMLSVFIAFVVAWTFYVQPYRLASSYVRSPELAEKVAAMAKDVSEEYKKQVDNLEAALATPDADPLKAKEEIEAAIRAFKSEVENANLKVANLQGLGVAVGWPDGSKIVKCGTAVDAGKVIKGEQVDGFCKTRLLWSDDVIMPGFGETFWLLVGGLLVGLGAPFWAQAVSNLSATRGLSEKIVGIVTTGGSAAPKSRSMPTAAGTPAAGAPTSVPPPQTTDSPLREIFELSRRQPKKT
jgi:hypothetical protein